MPGFDERSAKRIAQAVRRVEAMPASKADAVDAPQILQPSCYAIVATAITAASGTTLGMGTATIQVVAYDPSSAVGTYATSGVTVTVYHGGTSGIAVGRLIQLKVIAGRFHVDVDYC